MNRYTVAVLVNNQFGVLNRVTSMFRRRQFNIISLTVSETESNALSRITVTFEGGETQKQQLVNQLYKLPDVCSIKEFTPDTSVSCELMLIKLKNDSKTRVTPCRGGRVRREDHGLLQGFPDALPDLRIAKNR